MIYKGRGIVKSVKTGTPPNMVACILTLGSVLEGRIGGERIKFPKATKPVLPRKVRGNTSKHKRDNIARRTKESGQKAAESSLTAHTVKAKITRCKAELSICFSHFALVPKQDRLKPLARCVPLLSILPYPAIRRIIKDYTPRYSSCGCPLRSSPCNLLSIRTAMSSSTVEMVLMLNLS